MKETDAVVGGGRDGNGYLGTRPSSDDSAAVKTSGDDDVAR